MSDLFSSHKELLNAKTKLEARIFSDNEINKLRQTGPKAFATSFKNSVKEQKKLGIENIVGVGIGVKYKGGIRTNQICLKVFVRKKFLESNIESSYIVGKTENGFMTDVIAIGEVRAFSNGSRYRPNIPCGCSIGTPSGSGTLGCLVKDNEQIYILSNNHVLNDSVDKKNPPTDILQPGGADYGTSYDKIAELYGIVPIDFTTSNNFVDIALAKPLPNVSLLPLILQSGEIRGEVDPVVDMNVKKTGRTTVLTHGKIDDTDVKIEVNYGKHSAVVNDTFVISGDDQGIPFSDIGDSGSIILTRDNFACGLLFAGSGDGIYQTFANPIKRVVNGIHQIASNNATLWKIAW